ncbi:hypothetical protein ECHOSC_0841 [Ehrlichia chaffeensis str. Osceola]|nr:hypothetical protein ECHJAX_0219 [Ehrlichia chaffeensis str. Jax]AHX07172.1 hypothetical protein ECHOSC_0841 [Ehrlichia chaffeensis str. Osceola]
MGMKLFFSAKITSLCAISGGIQNSGLVNICCSDTIFGG